MEVNTFLICIGSVRTLVFAGEQLNLRFDQVDFFHNMKNEVNLAAHTCPNSESVHSAVRLDHNPSLFL